MDDNIRKFLETQAVMRRQLEPLSAAIKAMQETSAAARLAEQLTRQETVMRRHLEPFAESLKLMHEHSAAARLAKELTRHDKAMRAAYGPIEELRRSGLLDALKIDSDFAPLGQQWSQMQDRFRLPELTEANKLVEQLDQSRLAANLFTIEHDAALLQRAMETMRSPWLDMQDKLGSIAAFSELQGIGNALRTLPAFDSRLTQALRIELGDWQSEIAWPADIFTDAVARTSFYETRGLNPNLTAFPAEAFQQSIEIAGLKSTTPHAAQAYCLEAEVLDEEEQGFERTNAAHDRLVRFESRLREFIVKKMRQAFGESWMKHQVPGPMRQEWLEKQAKARDSGERESPLIAYADFTDYVPLITRKDNWEKVFKPVFRRQTFVQESFQRLYPIRICTMHARLITQDDELYLYVETKRVLEVISVSGVTR